MIADVSGRLVGLMLGVPIVVVITLVGPSLSTRRNLVRARTTGAIWAGMANIDASTEQAPVVAHAMVSLGGVPGASLTGYRQRIVGGQLYVFADRVHWEPRLWLGRGHAEPWHIPRSAILGVQIQKWPAPSFRSFDVWLHTEEGDIKLGIVDPQGLEAALQGGSSHPDST